MIIGAGQAGGPLADAFAQAGKKTALIAREHTGGTCINEGCTPTKTMMASARGHPVIDPQLGHVGLSEQEARNPHLPPPVARGMLQAIVAGASDQIRGFTVLGRESGEIMAMVQLARMGKLPYTTLRDAVFVHPTLAESLDTLFATLEYDQKTGRSSSYCQPASTKN